MSAYNRDGLSIEAYLVRIIAALCKQAGGELRVKGELVDTVGEATALLKSWDSKTQELVLTVTLGTFGEVFRVIPERQTGPTEIRPAPERGKIVDPLSAVFGEDKAKTFTPKTSTVDNPNLAALEHKRDVARAVAVIREELRNRKLMEQP